jgi:hypothetical protein
MHDIVLSLNYLQVLEKIKAMSHLPYLPGMAPSYFWLFSCLKGKFDAYANSTSIAKAITKKLNSTPIHEH